MISASPFIAAGPNSCTAYVFPVGGQGSLPQVVTPFVRPSSARLRISQHPAPAREPDVTRMTDRPAQDRDVGVTAILPTTGLEGIGQDIGLAWSMPFAGGRIVPIRIVPYETYFDDTMACAPRGLRPREALTQEPKPRPAFGGPSAAFARRLEGAD
jgi:hypothetical protein